MSATEAPTREAKKNTKKTHQDTQSDKQKYQLPITEARQTNTHKHTENIHTKYS
jgi:hypothetical protein